MTGLTGLTEKRGKQEEGGKKEEAYSSMTPFCSGMN